MTNKFVKKVTINNNNTDQHTRWANTHTILDRVFLSTLKKSNKNIRKYYLEDIFDLLDVIKADKLEKNFKIQRCQKPNRIRIYNPILII